MLQQIGLLLIRVFVSEILAEVRYNPIFVFWQISDQISISDGVGSRLFAPSSPVDKIGFP